MELVLLGSRAFPLLHGRRHEGSSDGVPALWHHRCLCLQCPYRDAFARAPKKPLPPFHILPIDGEQLGTRAMLPTQSTYPARDPAGQSAHGMAMILTERRLSRHGAALRIP